MELVHAELFVLEAEIFVYRNIGTEGYRDVVCRYGGEDCKKVTIG